MTEREDKTPVAPSGAAEHDDAHDHGLFDADAALDEDWSGALPGLPAILVDSSKFKELLMELLKNAAEAAQKGGGRCALKICGPGVITPAEQRRVDVLVSNTGSQIPPEKIQEVFRPFHGSKNSNHLGLGLTIAAMLSHQMNIQLGVASENNTMPFC